MPKLHEDIGHFGLWLILNEYIISCESIHNTCFATQQSSTCNYGHFNKITHFPILCTEKWLDEPIRYYTRAHILI